MEILKISVIIINILFKSQVHEKKNLNISLQKG